MRRKAIGGVVSNRYFRVNATTFLKSENGMIQLSFSRFSVTSEPTLVPINTEEYIVRVFDDRAIFESPNGSRFANIFQAEQRADNAIRQHFPRTKIIDSATSC